MELCLLAVSSPARQRDALSKSWTWATSTAFLSFNLIKSISLASFSSKNLWGASIFAPGESNVFLSAPPCGIKRERSKLSCGSRANMNARGKSNTSSCFASLICRYSDSWCPAKVSLFEGEKFREVGNCSRAAAASEEQLVISSPLLSFASGVFVTSRSGQRLHKIVN